MKTVQECINWLWENNRVGGKDFDGVWGLQCVDLPKGLMQYCGVASWNKARGNGKDVVQNLLNDGLVTKTPTTQNRIRIVSVGPQPFPYGHVFVIVDNTVFEQNTTKAVSLDSVKKRGYTYWLESYPNFIVNDSSPIVKGKTGLVNVASLNVRDEPSINGKIVANYVRGQKIYNLSFAKISDGFVWYTYLSQSGKKRYVAVGKNTGKAENDDYIKF